MIATSEIRLLPLAEKLALLEVVWTEFCGEEEKLEVPDWHREILDDRQKSLDDGSMEILDWDVAKQQIDREIR
jgi:hypothetical protein